MSTHKIVVKGGKLHYLYDDRLDASLAKLPSTATITRASHVEPHPDPSRPGWVADMTPSDGPVIGANGERWDAPPISHGWSGWHKVEPFTTRQAALDAERAWLENGRLALN